MNTKIDTIRRDVASAQALRMRSYSMGFAMAAAVIIAIASIGINLAVLASRGL